MKFDLNLKKGMTEIACIKDSDFGISCVDNIEEPIVRLGSRGIVINENDEIAIFVKEKKNEYKLPGGGIKDNEEPSVAFKRECEEELGCSVDIIEELGTIVEDKSQENFKQLSFVFVAKKVNDLGPTQLTQKEKDEGSKFIWLSKYDALDKMKNCLNNLRDSEYDSIYRTKFMVLRDIKILEYYLNHIN